MTVPSARIALQTPSVIRMIASLLCLRESWYRLRSVPGDRHLPRDRIRCHSPGNRSEGQDSRFGWLRFSGNNGLELRDQVCADYNRINAQVRICTVSANAFYRDRKVIAGPPARGRASRKCFPQERPGAHVSPQQYRSLA